MATSTKTTAPADSVNITNKPEVIAAARRAAELKALEKIGKDAEKERKALEETILRPALQGKRFAILRGVKAYTLSTPRENSHIDKDELLAAFPEAYAATLKKTPYTFLTYNLG